MATIYKSQPLHVQSGIPVYSAQDRYTDNYTKIAHDHLQAQKPGMDNPFMENQLWETLERSTAVLVGKHIAPGARILDVGVGLGRVLGPLTQYERHGIDISFDYLEKAAAQGIEVAWARIEDMPYVDECFDAVMACDVLEHVLDLHAATQQILRVLKPGGVLILRVPYREDLEVYLRTDLPYEFVHLRSFDVPSLRLHFEKIFGCTYIEHATVAPYLQGAPRLKLRLLPAASKIHQMLPKSTKIFGKARAHPLDLLKKAATVTEDEFVNWIYALRDKHPDLFAMVAEDLVHGIEVNVVFRKPLRAD